MKIGLLGFGVVGRGVYDLTADRDDISVAKVVCLEDVSLPDAEVTKDFQSVLNDESIDTIVEAMGGLHPAYEFVRASIEAGKNVVTSNKALVAAFYDELLPLVQEKGVLFRCTAAVGGGICWLSELERVRRCESVVKLGGIMNGTCNYILDNMTRNRLDYNDVLKQAQALGYAEANPATDVDGIDTWNKLIISCNVAWGVSLEQSQVPAAGIRNIQAQDISAFADHGRVCRLVSTGEKDGDKITAYVQPKLFPRTDLEANVPANFNLITFEGSYCGRMSLYGQGAGRYPTAYNVMQDCVDLLRGNGFYSVCTGKANVCNDVKLCFYVRGASDAWLDSVTTDVWGEGVITSPVSVSEMHAWCAQHPDVFMASLA